MELEAGRNLLEEGKETWVLVDNYMDKMMEELPEVAEEEVKITPIVAATTSTDSNSDDTDLPNILTATLFLLVLNTTYMFRALVSTPSGVVTFVVACSNALCVWSILNAISRSSLVSCQGVRHDDEKREDLIAPETPAPQMKHDYDDEEEEKYEPTPKGTSTLPSRNAPAVLPGRVTEDKVRAVFPTKGYYHTRSSYCTSFVKED